jgi:hypothetical protein
LLSAPFIANPAQVPAVTGNQVSVVQDRRGVDELLKGGSPFGIQVLDQWSLGALDSR